MRRRPRLPALAAALGLAGLLAAGCSSQTNAERPNQENTGPPLPASSGPATIPPSAPTPRDTPPLP